MVTLSILFLVAFVFLWLVNVVGEFIDRILPETAAPEKKDYKCKWLYRETTKSKGGKKC